MQPTGTYRHIQSCAFPSWVHAHWQSSPLVHDVHLSRPFHHFTQKEVTRFEDRMMKFAVPIPGPVAAVKCFKSLTALGPGCWCHVGTESTRRDDVIWDASTSRED